MDNHGAWTGFYDACCQKLLGFDNRRHELFLATRKLAVDEPRLAYLHFENREFWEERNQEIDPFSVLAIFNRSPSGSHRTDLAQLVGKMLGVELAPPREFHGIPHLDARRSVYPGNAEMWALFGCAVQGAHDEAFQNAYDNAAHVKGNAIATLSMGLFWAKAEKYMAIDAMSRPFIQKVYGLECPADKATGREYVECLEALRQKLPPGDMAFANLAFEAWQAAQRAR